MSKQRTWGGRFTRGVGVSPGVGVAVGIGVGLGLGVALAVGAGVGSGVSLGASVALGVGVGGQPLSTALMAVTTSLIVTRPSPFRSKLGHVLLGWRPRAIFTPRRISSTVTIPSPLQSPGQAIAAVAEDR